MTLYPRLSAPRASLPTFSLFPFGRRTHSDPLRRLFGLRLLSEPLPDPLRTHFIRAWQFPAHFDRKQAIQSQHRQRPDVASLPFFPPALLSVITLIELEVARRVVETPRTEITREMRNKLLSAQGAYLRGLYAALAAQLGEAVALAELERLVLKVV